MKDYFLRAENEEAMNEALEAAQLPDNTSIDVIGIIYEETGETLVDSDGIEYPETAPVNGWHVNIRTIKPLTQEQLNVLPVIDKPNNPVRVFAGGVL